MKALRLAIFAVGGIALALVLAKPSVGGFDQVLQTSNVLLEVDVATPPLPPAPASGGSAANSVKTDAFVDPQPTQLGVVLSARKVVIAAKPGQTSIVPCPMKIVATRTIWKGFYQVLGALTDPTFTSYIYSFPEQFNFKVTRSSLQNGKASYYWDVAPVYSQYGEYVSLFEQQQLGATTRCLGFSVKVPAGTRPGRYYDQFIVAYSAPLLNGPIPLPGSPSPSPTPTMSPSPTPTPSMTTSPTPTPTPPLYPKVVLADGPSMYFHFDQGPANLGQGATIPDVSGNANNGSVLSGSVTSVSGAIANWSDPAFDFVQGSQIAGPYAPTVGAFSVEAWVRINNGNSALILGGEQGTCPNIFELYVSPSNAQAPVQTQTPGQVVAEIGQGPANHANNLPATGVASSSNISQGSWHYIVATWSATAGQSVAASQFQLYIDGVSATGAQLSEGNLGLVSPIPMYGQVPNGVSSPYCSNAGGWAVSAGAGSDYDVDELATYESVLTPTQILHHYQVGIGTASSLRHRR